MVENGGFDKENGASSHADTCQSGSTSSAVNKTAATTASSTSGANSSCTELTASRTSTKTVTNTLAGALVTVGAQTTQDNVISSSVCADTTIVEEAEGGETDNCGAETMVADTTILVDTGTMDEAIQVGPDLVDKATCTN